MLGVVRHFQPGVARHEAAGRAEGVGDEFEESGFAAAIKPDDADAVAEVDGEGDVLED